MGGESTQRQGKISSRKGNVQRAMEDPKHEKTEASQCPEEANVRFPCIFEQSTGVDQAVESSSDEC